MTISSVLPATLSTPRADVVRRTGAAGLAAALTAVADRGLDRIEFREGGAGAPPPPLPPPAGVLAPALHHGLADAQVWLLSWLPEQGTPLHAHGSSAGAFAVVQGTLTERGAAAGLSGNRVRESTAELTGGRVRHFGPHYVHQVTN